MVFESSNTKLIFGMWKFKNTQKKTKQKTNRDPLLHLEKINTINKPILAFFILNKKPGQKKTLKSQIKQMELMAK